MPNESNSATYSRRYRQKHPEKVRARKKAYRLAHPEEQTKARQRTKAHYRANTEKAIDYQKAYRLANVERLREYRRARYAANAATIQAKVLVYAKTHPEIIKAARSRRRALKANAPRNDFTHSQWLTLQEAQSHRCYYCGKRCKGRLTQDHITPLSKGGSHTLSNVIGACRSCNASKGNKAPPCPVQPFLL